MGQSKRRLKKQQEQGKTTNDLFPVVMYDPSTHKLLFPAGEIYFDYDDEKRMLIPHIDVDQRFAEFVSAPEKIDNLGTSLAYGCASKSISKVDMSIMAGTLLFAFLRDWLKQKETLLEENHEGK